MKLLKDKDGEPALLPIDFFMGAKKIADWIMEEPSKENIEFGPPDMKVEQILFRAELYFKAKDLYQKSSGNKDFKNLREDPYVVTNYDYGVEAEDGFPVLRYWFLFKEDNNGSTYKIYC